jgi:hypothetical protein
VIGGKGGVVSVVAPSYDYSDVVVWTSTDSGTSFHGPQVITSADYDGTGVDDVLRSPDADAPYYPDVFSISSSNPGLFYTFTGIGSIGARNPPAGFQFDVGSVPGAVVDSTVGYGATLDPGPNQRTQTVEAFSTNADNPRLAYFWSPLPGVSGSPGSLEHGPVTIGVGIDPRLAGGPDGLFLLSLDPRSGPDKPLHLDVRRWDPSTKTFGPPTQLTTIPDSTDAGDEGGITEDNSTGSVTVAWPITTATGVVMDVWTSTDHGTSFSGPLAVADVGYGYDGPARLASVGGRGFLTWQDHNGLELVDLDQSHS